MLYLELPPPYTKEFGEQIPNPTVNQDNLLNLETSQPLRFMRYIFYPPLDQINKKLISPTHSEYKFVTRLRFYITAIYAVLTILGIWTFVINIIIIIYRGWFLQQLLSNIHFCSLFYVFDITFVITLNCLNTNRSLLWNLNIKVLLYGIVKIYFIHLAFRLYDIESFLLSL